MSLSVTEQTANKRSVIWLRTLGNCIKRSTWCRKCLLNSDGLKFPEILLSDAVRRGHETCTWAAVEEGADVNKLNGEGSTPLIIAASLGYVNCVNMLVKSGADVNRKGLGEETALIEAAKNGHWKCVEMLVKSGADVNTIGEQQRTALIEATLYGHVECAKRLLKAGADVNMVDYLGNTALSETLKNPLAKGAKVLQYPNDRVKCKTGGTKIALLEAGMEVQRKLLNLLRARGVNYVIGQFIEKPSTHFLGFQKSGKCCVTISSKYKNKPKERKKKPQIQNRPKKKFDAKVRKNHSKYRKRSPIWKKSAMKKYPKKKKGKSFLATDRTLEDQQKIITNREKYRQARKHFLKRKRFRVEYLKKNLKYETASSIVSYLEIGTANTSNQEKVVLIPWVPETVPQSSNQKKTGSPESLEDDQKKSAPDEAFKIHKGTVKMLISKGADVNKKLSSGFTLLMYAAAKGQNECIDLLLKAGAYLNLMERKGNTALIIAASLGHNDCVKSLIQAGADVNIANNDGQTALIKATFYGYETTVILLLKSGADVNKADCKEDTPLFKALDNPWVKGYYALEKSRNTMSLQSMEAKQRLQSKVGGMLQKVLVKLLIEEGSDVNKKRSNGQSPLMKAAHRGMYECIDLLLKAGANVNAVDNNHDSALTLIGGHDKRLAMISKLITAGANVNAVNNDNETALIKAAANGINQNASLLIRSGADVKICDKSGKNSFSVAEKNGHKKCVIGMWAAMDQRKKEDK